MEVSALPLEFHMYYSTYCTANVYFVFYVFPFLYTCVVTQEGKGKDQPHALLFVIGILVAFKFISGIPSCFNLKQGLLWLFSVTELISCRTLS